MQFNLTHLFANVNRWKENSEEKLVARLKKWAPMNSDLAPHFPSNPFDKGTVFPYFIAIAKYEPNGIPTQIVPAAQVA
ncbi:MAG: hypothetical protein NTW14_03195 [bacterium]|nr:hypothetical protein [bacterium]